MISSHYALVMTDLQAISYQKLSSPMNTTKAQMTNVLSTILICCMYSGAVDWSAAIWKLICICFTVLIYQDSQLLASLIQWQCTTETTILVQFRYRNRNLNWLIVSADTVTDTETTFQRENVVTNSMGYFSHLKTGP